MRTNAFFIVLCAAFASVVAFLGCAWLLHQRFRPAPPAPASAAPAPLRTSGLSAAGPELAALLRTRPTLACPPAQHLQLLALYADMQRTRRVHEAAIAVCHPHGRDAVEITIPAYPEVGAQLRARFMQGLADSLGADYAHRFETEAGDDLAQQMCGFGQQAQVLIVRLDRAADAYEIKHEYRVESPDGPPALRTRFSRVSRSVLDHYAALAALLPK